MGFLYPKLPPVVIEGSSPEANPSTGGFASRTNPPKAENPFGLAITTSLSLGVIQRGVRFFPERACGIIALQEAFRTMVIAVFILIHWYLALFFQSFFLHRYVSHRMYSMPLFWERFFYLFSVLSQGIYLPLPKAYAIIHRLHHAHSDTEMDPHSPFFHKTPLHLAIRTALFFLEALHHPSKFGREFSADCPEWPGFDKLVTRPAFRFIGVLSLALFYIAIYIHFATSPWMYLFLPLHFFMGLISGTLVNWCAHRYDCNTRFDKRTWNWAWTGFFLFAETPLHSHHHRHPAQPNFAKYKFDWDPTHASAMLFNRLGILYFCERSEMR